MSLDIADGKHVRRCLLTYRLALQSNNDVYVMRGSGFPLQARNKRPRYHIANSEIIQYPYDLLQ